MEQCPWIKKTGLEWLKYHPQLQVNLDSVNEQGGLIDNGWESGSNAL